MYRIDEKSKGAELKKVDFFYTAPAGSHVSLAGSFNDWDPEADMMTFSAESGTFTCSLMLPQGSYEYKMVVDDNWMLDESNPNFTANDFGTLNSVLTVN